MPINVAIGQSYMNHHCHRLFINSNSDVIRNMSFRESNIYVVLINKYALEFVDETADERVIALTLSLVLEILNSEMLRV